MMKTVAQKSVIKKSTLKEVAERAGVSPATVSRALSRPERVSEKTRATVLKVARELNYQPNQFARALKRQNSNLIALLITDLQNPFYASIAKGLQATVAKQGYSLILCDTNESSEREKGYLEELAGLQLSGLIIVPTETTKDNLNRLVSVPIVEVDRTSGFTHSHAVLIDNRAGARDAVEHLIGLGHRRIGFISGRPTLTTGSERRDGYLDAMRSADLRVDEAWIVLNEHHSEEGGCLAAAELLTLPESRRPTALFAFNNESAAGAIRALREKNLSIPTDVSVVGFDDSRWAQLMYPPLTVVEQPAYDLGCLAGERLFGALSNKGIGRTVVRLSPKLIVRGSTAAPKEAAPREAAPEER